MDYIIYSVVLVFILGLIYVGYKVYTNEKKGRQFRKNMKVGSSAYFTTEQGAFVSGVIDKIDGDNVLLSVLVKRDRLYPQNIK